MLVLDVDGVLSDGTIVYDDTGREWKTFYVRDGHGIVMARRAGIVPVIISGRDSRAVDQRAAELGIEHVHQGIRDKVACFRRILRSSGLGEEAAAFIGDDVVDLPLLRRVGLSAAPCDADSVVLAEVMFRCRRPGGRGAVRELIDFILTAQGRLGDGIP